MTGLISIFFKRKGTVCTGRMYLGGKQETTNKCHESLLLKKSDWTIFTAIGGKKSCFYHPPFFLNVPQLFKCCHGLLFRYHRFFFSASGSRTGKGRFALQHLRHSKSKMVLKTHAVYFALRCPSCCCKFLSMPFFFSHFPASW